MDESKFEVIADSATGYSDTNDAWMYTGSAIKPSVKVTHVPTGYSTTVGAASGLNAQSYDYGQGSANIYGVDGYGSVTVKKASNVSASIGINLV